MNQRDCEVSTEISSSSMQGNAEMGEEICGKLESAFPINSQDIRHLHCHSKSLNNQAYTMKLLGWMQRRPQNDNKGFVKTSAIGSICTCFPIMLSKEDYSEPKDSSRAARQLQHDSIMMDPPAAIAGEIFPGFLTIGTLAVNDPPTPKFESSNEEIVEEKIGHSNYDFGFVGDELEKFILENFLKPEESETSSWQSQESKGSSRRTSEASIITISNNEGVVEGSDLQQYLLGSLDIVATKENKEKEYSFLDEALRGSRTPYGKSDVSSDKGLKCDMRKHKSPMHQVKKLFKTLQLPSKKLASSNHHAATESLPRKAKFHKCEPSKQRITSANGLQIKQLFYKKVHPEVSRSAKESSIFSMKTNNPTSCHDYRDQHQVAGSYDKTRIYHQASSKSAERNSSGNLTPASKELSKMNMKLTPVGFYSTSSRQEYWIKTDDQFLVLELHPTKRGA
ncbi:hypothetical protein AKJ16_DCAP13482 [Drosera capensis]